MKLEGKVAIITGSSRDIGRAIALEFAREGANVIVTYNRNWELGNGVVREIRELGRESRLVKYTLDSETGAKELVDIATNNFESVDILVNCAATHHEKDFLDYAHKEIQQELENDLIAPMRLCQEVLPIMNSGGSIINIASVGGQWGGQYAIPYACAKAGIINLTRSLAKTYGHLDIRVNAISPGLILTATAAAEINSEIGLEKLAGIPLGRFGNPEEIAKVAVFLASEEASYVNGQTINVNGGQYMG